MINPALAAIRNLPLRPAYVAAVLLGSFLLFLVQPLFGRLVLPVLGGSPNVWNVAMLFYQAVLLLGYLYADRLQRWPVRRQVAIHIGLYAVAAATLPIGIAAWYPAAGSGNPTPWLLGLLAVSIGPVFFVVSAQAPLLQAWFARTSDRDAANPYFLYAASNLGSFAALVAYPLLVEPLAGLVLQREAWSAGFVALALLTALCGLAAVGGQAAATAPAALEPVAITGAQKLRWVALSAVASGLLLSTTTHLTTDLMAMPLLWVVPLAIYLLSFVLGFSAAGPVITARAVNLAPVLLLLVGTPVFLSGYGPAWGVVLAIAGLLLLLVLTVALHGTLANERPPADSLTSFYLWLSVGGAVGGLFCALIAPMIFSWPWEHPLLLLAAAWLLPGDVRSRLADRPVRAGLMLGLAALAAVAIITDFGRVALMPRPAPTPAVGAGLFLLITLAWLSIGRRRLFLAMLLFIMLALGGAVQLVRVLEGKHERSFFGVYTVEDTPDGRFRGLKHGTTLHGIQALDPGSATRPLTYYVPGSGVGRAMQAAAPLYGPQARIGVVGLGAGTLACYARPGQAWTLFEIDPAVEAIARSRFSYLSRCSPAARVVIGDARLTLQAVVPASFDLLAVDAFSSDSIPLHMMTREAVRVYGRALAADGLLLVHVSNRFLDLEPVMAALARAEGWQARILPYSPARTLAVNTGASGSQWIALSRDPARLEALVARGGPWRRLRERPGLAAWSDDFASVLPVLRWRQD